MFLQTHRRTSCYQRSLFQVAEISENQLSVENESHGNKKKNIHVYKIAFNCQLAAEFSLDMIIVQVKTFCMSAVLCICLALQKKLFSILHLTTEVKQLK